MANRHERRKAAKVFETKWIPAKQIVWSDCAWKGCTATCKLHEELPSGWSALLLTRSRRAAAGSLLDIPPSECLRDTCLCPEHTRLFDSQLKDLHRELTAPAAGSA
jgi:hypothetical protein